MTPFYSYARQSISSEDMQAVEKALSGNIITRGSTVEAFEDAVAKYCQAEYAVAFNSGTSALHAACHAARVNANDRIITTPNTFAASIIAGMRMGAKPILIDIDRRTGNLDDNLLQECLSQFELTRGRPIVVPVHFAGIPVDMKKIEKNITIPDAVIIEDAAHALGSRYSDGKPVGCCAHSDMTVLSFHAVKTITTGEGGMVLTNCGEYFQRLKRFRNNGVERNPALLHTSDFYEGYYEVLEMTGNYNFTDFQAALGLSQLSRIDTFIQKRRELIKTYRKQLEGFPYIQMFTSEYDDSVAFHLAVLQIDFDVFNTTRAHVMAKLKEKGIGTQVHYIPLYRHPFLKIHPEIDFDSYFPNMETYFAQALSFPLYYDLSVENVTWIVQTLKDVLVIEREKKYNKQHNRKSHRHRLKSKKR